MGFGIEAIGANKAGKNHYASNIFGTHKKPDEKDGVNNVNQQVAFLPNIGNLLNGSQHGVSTSAVRA